MAMANNLAKLYSAEIEGVLARLIEIEVDLNVGLHAFNIVGLADKALNEARERVNSALKNSGVKPPNRENRKITVNLAPADVKKAGSQYDLALALGYLLATKQIKEFEVGDKIFIGELALDGRLRPVNGALNIAQMAERAGFKYIFLPKEKLIIWLLAAANPLFTSFEMNLIFGYFGDNRGGGDPRRDAHGGDRYSRRTVPDRSRGIFRNQRN